MTLSTVYIETSVVSYLTDKPQRNVLKYARVLHTTKWWMNRRSAYSVWTSSFTLDEAKNGDAQAAKIRLDHLSDLPLLELNEAVYLLASDLSESGIFPKKCEVDIGHISVAAVHQIDILLTWNCSHIANPVIARMIEPIIWKHGFRMPFLATPEELLGDRK